MSARKRFYQGVQITARGMRLSVSKLEDNSRFDTELLEQLKRARTALEMAEHISALRLAEEKAAV